MMSNQGMAKQLRRAVERELDDRRDLGFTHLDDDVLAELRQCLEEIFVETLEGKQHEPIWNEGSK